MTIKTKALKNAVSQGYAAEPQLEGWPRQIRPSHSEWVAEAMLAAYREVSAARTRHALSRRAVGRGSLSGRDRVALVGLQSAAGRLLDGALALLHLPRTDFVILWLR